VEKTLLESYNAARCVTQKHAKSFYFSSFALNKVKRRRAYAIYAYCRHCDDWIDMAPPGCRKQATKELREFTAKLFQGDIHTEQLAWAEAFRDTCLKCQVPIELCYELIHGVCLDAEGKVQIPNWYALREYCYYVASVVGLLMLYVLEPADFSQARAHAVDMGIGMQLTNILRDVREDAFLGRCYLPHDELVHFGLDGRDFRDEKVYRSREWKSYAVFFAERARQHYCSAAKGISLLPQDGSRYCVLCMQQIYQAILDKIQSADWDVSQRRYVSFLEKLLIAWRARKL